VPEGYSTIRPYTVVDNISKTSDSGAFIRPRCQCMTGRDDSRGQLIGASFFAWYFRIIERGDVLLQVSIFCIWLGRECSRKFFAFYEIRA